MQTGLPDGLHLVTSCENSQYQAVQVGSNAADVSTSDWYSSSRPESRTDSRFRIAVGTEKGTGIPPTTPLWHRLAYDSRYQVCTIDNHRDAAVFMPQPFL